MDGIEPMHINLRKPRKEEGNITVMAIGFLMLLGLFVVVVVNASAVFLEHRKLANLADAIALAASDVVDETYYQAHLDLDQLTIDRDAALNEAQTRVDADTRMMFDVVGNEVLVRLERPVALWIVPGWSAHTQVVAEARAQLTVIEPA